MKRVRTNERHDVRIYGWNQKYVKTINRTFYRGFGGDMYVKYDDRYYKVFTTTFASEGLKYNIRTGD